MYYYVHLLQFCTLICMYKTMQYAVEPWLYKPLRYQEIIKVHVYN